MDEIFLQDYANNVAQAKDPFGIAAVQAQPGFENYQPSFANQDLTPMGLVNDTPSRLPDFREMAKNVAKNQIKNYMIEENYEMNQRKMQNEINKQQIQAIQTRLDSEPISNQDRGRGQVTTSPATTTSAPAARQSRHTSGVGGLHSGY